MSVPNAYAAPLVHLVGPGKLRVLAGRLTYSRPGKSAVRLDPRRLRALFCYGGITLTDEALRLLLRHHVELALLDSRTARCRGRVVGPRDSAAELRRRQHRAAADPAATLALARRIVLEKLQTQIAAARHYQRQGDSQAGRVVGQLKELRRRAETESGLDPLRGLEGAAARAWYQLLAGRFTPPWSFPGRKRRPPTDPVNALLSLASTFLHTRLVAAIQARGLEPTLGSLHAWRPGRASLACDLMEPLRADLVDRWVVATCNRKLVLPEHFQAGDPGVRLHAEQFGRVLHSWETQCHAGEGGDRLAGCVDAFITSLRAVTELPTPENA